MRSLAILLLCCASLSAQGPSLPFGFVPSVGVTPITLDGSGCSNTSSSAVNISCSLTSVTAGDIIAGFCFTTGSNFDFSTLFANDPINGYYGMVRGAEHSSNTLTWVSPFIYANSASGTITPQCQDYEPDGLGIFAQAIKGTRTSFVMDGGAVNLSKSATGANPTAGTAASPANANEMVLCQLVRATAATTSAGSGFSPTGTLTGVTQTLAQYFQYQIQTSATSVNCPYTSASAAYLDNQEAILNASTSAGYMAASVVYGLPAAAQTNGASATATILNTASGSLSPFAPAAGSVVLFSGSATTFDTSVKPLGSLKLLINGVPHTVGDAGTSIKIPSANTSTSYGIAPLGIEDLGRGAWTFQFVQEGTNSAASQVCDNENMDNLLVDGNVTTQFYTDASNVMQFRLELNAGNTPGLGPFYPATPTNFGQPYGIINHYAGVNDTTGDIYILGEATPGTLPWTVIDHISYPRTGPVQGTASGTAASSGLSSITVTSSTVQPSVGQVVWSATGGVDTGQLTLGTTLVTSVTGTCSTTCTVAISTPTLATMAAVPLIFTGMTATTTGSTTAGSTALTVGSGTGIVAGNQGTGSIIAMAGVQAGTFVVSGSGTSWTLSQPATSNESTVTASFWPPPGGSFESHSGKYSSCNSTADYWYSGTIMDYYGTFLPQVAAGTLAL